MYTSYNEYVMKSLRCKKKKMKKYYYIIYLKNTFTWNEMQKMYQHVLIIKITTHEIKFVKFYTRINLNNGIVDDDTTGIFRIVTTQK